MTLTDEEKQSVWHDMRAWVKDNEGQMSDLVDVPYFGRRNLVWTPETSVEVSAYCSAYYSYMHLCYNKIAKALADSARYIDFGEKP